MTSTPSKAAGRATKPFVMETVPVNRLISVLRLKGSVDASTVDRLESALGRLLECGIWRIAVDLAGVDFLSSSAYSCLIGFHELSEQNGGRIVFVGAPLGIREVFRLLGLAEVLHFAQELAVAIRHLSDLGRPRPFQRPRDLGPGGDRP